MRKLTLILSLLSSFFSSSYSQKNNAIEFGNGIEVFEGLEGLEHEIFETKDGYLVVSSVNFFGLVRELVITTFDKDLNGKRTKTNFRDEVSGLYGYSFDSISNSISIFSRRAEKKSTTQTLGVCQFDLNSFSLSERFRPLVEMPVDKKENVYGNIVTLTNNNHIQIVSKIEKKGSKHYAYLFNDDFDEVGSIDLSDYEYASIIRHILNQDHIAFRNNKYYFWTSDGLAFLDFESMKSEIAVESFIPDGSKALNNHTQVLPNGNLLFTTTLASNNDCATDEIQIVEIDLITNSIVENQILDFPIMLHTKGLEGKEEKFVSKVIDKCKPRLNVDFGNPEINYVKYSTDKITLVLTNYDYAPYDNSMSLGSASAGPLSGAIGISDKGGIESMRHGFVVKYSNGKLKSSERLKVNQIKLNERNTIQFALISKNNQSILVYNKVEKDKGIDFVKPANNHYLGFNSISLENFEDSKLHIYPNSKDPFVILTQTISQFGKTYIGISLGNKGEMKLVKM